MQFLPNPGREEQYKSLTGKDKPVIEYLSQFDIVAEYLNHANQIVDLAVGNYLNRGFTSLMISFGCTGGQHRSVYCANELAAYLENNFDIQVSVSHREQELN